MAKALGTKFGCPWTNDLGRYLGVPLYNGWVRRNTYKYITDKADQKLAGWKISTLSFAGRVTRAQSMLQAILSYSIQTTLLPMSVCDDIEAKTCSFIWESTSSLVKWSLVYQPREQGGL